MLDETLASIIVAGGITGAGLVLAVYALITPIFVKISKARKIEIEEKKKEFYNIQSKKTKESTKNDLKRQVELSYEINSLSKFPRFLRELVIVDFWLFLLTAALETVSLWANANGANGYLIIGSITVNTNIDLMYNALVPFMFFFAIFIFGYIGLLAIFDVSSWMENEFKKAIADKKEIEKALKDATADISSSFTINKPQENEH